jgi:hypothetical protein
MNDLDYKEAIKALKLRGAWDIPALKPKPKGFRRIHCRKPADRDVVKELSVAVSNLAILHANQFHFGREK